MVVQSNLSDGMQDTFLHIPHADSRQPSSTSAGEDGPASSDLQSFRHHRWNAERAEHGIGNSAGDRGGRPHYHTQQSSDENAALCLDTFLFVPDTPPSSSCVIRR